MSAPAIASSSVPVSGVKVGKQGILLVVEVGSTVANDALAVDGDNRFDAI